MLIAHYRMLELISLVDPRPGSRLLEAYHVLMYGIGKWYGKCKKKFGDRMYKQGETSIECIFGKVSSIGKRWDE